jgi:hypothetical protein
MMRKAEPLPAIPDRMHTDRVDGLLPFVFGIPGCTQVLPPKAAAERRAVA